MINTILQASLSDPWFWVAAYCAGSLVLSMFAIGRLNWLVSKREDEIKGLRAFVESRQLGIRHQNCRCGMPELKIVKREGE